MNIVLAKTAGYCFGVSRALTIAEKAGKKGKNVYMYGQIIHNREVTDSLEKRGIKHVNSIEEIENSSCVIIRTHGVSKKVYDELLNKNCVLIDATCPFVKKIHQIVSTEDKNKRQIVIIGMREHPEVTGISGWCTKPLVFENCKELKSFIENEPGTENLPLSVVAQTTISREIWELSKELIKKTCKNVNFFDTICIATIKRQTEARKIASESDFMIIVGDRNSSNTKRLFEICSEVCSGTVLVENASELDIGCLKTADNIGVTAGASTPEWIIKEVLNKMSDEVKTASEQSADNLAGESFEELLEQSLKTLYTGEKVTGLITQVSPTEIHVDLGVKQSGYIPVAELSDDPSYKVDDDPEIKVGQSIDAFVMRVNDVEGTIMLSKKRLDTIKAWEKIEAARADKSPVEGVVIEENKGGIVVLVYGARVFVPASQSGLPKDSPLSTLLKTKVKLRITEVNRPKRRIVGSVRSVLMDEKRESAEKLWDTIEPGNKYTGTVKSITSYGVFVDIGGVDGMIHVSELSWFRVKHPSEVVKIGDVLDVFVISVDKEKRKISLGYKQKNENPWVIFTDKYKVGDTVPVKVLKFMPFGAFAEIIPGIDGLIHISQIADRRLSKPDEALKLGETVDAKIVDIDLDKKKVSLSIRALLEKSQPSLNAQGSDGIVATSGDDKVENMSDSINE